MYSRCQEPQHARNPMRGTHDLPRPTQPDASRFAPYGWPPRRAGLGGAAPSVDRAPSGQPCRSRGCTCDASHPRGPRIRWILKRQAPGRSLASRRAGALPPRQPTAVGADESAPPPAPVSEAPAPPPIQAGRNLTFKARDRVCRRCPSWLSGRLASPAPSRVQPVVRNPETVEQSPSRLTGRPRPDARPRTRPPRRARPSARVRTERRSRPPGSSRGLESPSPGRSDGGVGLACEYTS